MFLCWAYHSEKTFKLDFKWQKKKLLPTLKLCCDWEEEEEERKGTRASLMEDSGRGVTAGDESGRVWRLYRATNWLPWIHAASAINSTVSCCLCGRITNNSRICDGAVTGEGNRTEGVGDTQTLNLSQQHLLVTEQTGSKTDRKKGHGWWALFGKCK